MSKVQPDKTESSEVLPVAVKLEERWEEHSCYLVSDKPKSRIFYWINLFEHTGLLDLVTIWTHGILYYKYINLCASLAIWTNGNFLWFGIPPPIFNVRVSVIFLLVSYLIESQLQQNITQHHSVI